MSAVDRGPLRDYEIVWKSGHVETIQAHQVLFKSWALTGPDLLLGGSAEASGDPRVTFHAEIDGRWTLLLSALEDEISTVRDVTAIEQIGGIT